MVAFCGVVVVGVEHADSDVGGGRRGGRHGEVVDWLEFAVPGTAFSGAAARCSPQ